MQTQMEKYIHINKYNIIYIYIYIYILDILFKANNNQHFNQNISGTNFLNSCQHLQFFYSAYDNLKSKRSLQLPRDQILITIESRTFKSTKIF